MSNRLRVVRAALAAVVVLLTLGPAGALGHAELDTVTPADKSTVTPPTEIVMTFTENLDPAKSSITVLDAAGTVVVTGGTVDAGSTKRMRLAVPELAPARYTIRWTTFSSDDNELDRGTTTFTVIAASAPPSIAASASVAPSPSVAPPAAASPSTAAASPSSSPSPSGGPGTPPSTSTGDAVIPVIGALVVLAALGLWLLRGRSRRAG